jgi:DNA modification methylase
MRKLVQVSKSSNQESLAFDSDFLEAPVANKKTPAKNKKAAATNSLSKTLKEDPPPVIKTVAPNNTLNDLTGSEWKFSTKSVINKPYPVNMQHKLRSQHGGQKPPQLCADLIQTFTKKGQKVLDPFGGVGGTLLGAALIGRRATGIELDSRWIEIYKEVSKLENLEEQDFLLGDSKQVLHQLEPKSFDFILTDVPYWNIDKLAKTRSKTAKASKLATFNDSEDQTKEQWLDEMEQVMSAAHACLQDGKYAAVFIGDMYRESRYHMLSASLADRLETSGKWVLKANLIWYDVSKMLHVYGYPAAFVPSMIHQNILILKKG